MIARPFLLILAGIFGQRARTVSDHPAEPRAAILFTTLVHPKALNHFSRRGPKSDCLALLLDCQKPPLHSLFVFDSDNLNAASALQFWFGDDEVGVFEVEYFDSGRDPRRSGAILTEAAR